MVDVDAEAAEVLADEGEVDGLALLELFELPGLEEREDVGADVLGVERRSGGGGEISVDAEHGWGAGDQEDVGGVAAGGGVEDGFKGGGGLRTAGGGLLLARGGAVELRYELGEFAVVLAHPSRVARRARRAPAAASRSARAANSGRPSAGTEAVTIGAPIRVWPKRSCPMPKPPATVGETMTTRVILVGAVEAAKSSALL